MATFMLPIPSIQLVNISDIKFTYTQKNDSTYVIVNGEFYHPFDYDNLREWFVSFAKCKELWFHSVSNSKRDLWNCHKYALTRELGFITKYAAKKYNLNEEWLILVKRSFGIYLNNNRNIYPKGIFIVYDEETKEVAEIYYAYLTWLLNQNLTFKR